MIKLDLHIHSVASSYKERVGLVDNSTPENLDVLFQKLQENDIALFSITDHNRFNSKIYLEIDRILKSKQYPTVENILAGVEVDVLFDDGSRACHILTFFNAENKKHNYEKIEATFNTNKIDSPNGFYTGEQFERVLKDIDLDTILIACQRTSLEKTQKTNRSLSEASANPYEMISAGYISALEFQAPNVEGMIKSCLNNRSLQTGLLTGSDCHQWNVYPNHDSEQIKDSFQFTKANILPTFKGLVLAVTSPRFRINPLEWHGTYWTDGFKIGDKDVPLAKGVTAIIGENGSGKSTILDMLASNEQKWERDILRKSNISLEPKPLSDRIDYIKQGEIVKKFNKGEIFTDNDFELIDNSRFDSEYRNFSSQLMRFINNQVEFESTKEKLNNAVFDLEMKIPDSTFFVGIDLIDGFSQENNIHTDPLSSILDIISKLEKLLKDRYFAEFSEELNKSIEILRNIAKTISERKETVSDRITVKNIIESAVKDYKANVTSQSSSKDIEIENFHKKQNAFASAVVNACKLVRDKPEKPISPQPIFGGSDKLQNGFSFQKKTKYHERDVLQDYLEAMFNKGYQSLETILNICTEEELIKAIRGCTKATQKQGLCEKNLTSFLSNMHEETRFIQDVKTNGTKQLGNTLGELSLAYFKYIIQNDITHPIILLDQPEDHISNKHISQDLIGFINQIRHERQIIIVTHNPLLVVNLDVDQVIVLERTNESITAMDGPLEFESSQYSILDLIAECMDGGKEAIETRLKVYGKDNRY